ncbi:MAG: DNA-directed RNA polymerase subunit beta, partial [Deltaproteobacteria bacterium]
MLTQSKMRIRKDFSKVPEILDVPYLIQVQKESYEKFLQKDVKPEERKDYGLQGVFKSVFPIKNFNETASLEFVSYSLGSPKYEVEECKLKELTYAAPLKVLIRLVVWDVNQEMGTRNIRDIKEQEVYFGEIPLMTEKGTFIINGTERVVVSQLHRSPGIFFDQEKGKSHLSGKLFYSARIIPNRGSWLDLEFDSKDTIYVRIDRRRKFPVSLLLRAMGYTTEELLKYFYTVETVRLEKNKMWKSINSDFIAGDKAPEDIRNETTKELIVKKGKKITKATLEKLRQAKIRFIPTNPDDLEGKIVAEDIKDPVTGDVIVRCNEKLTVDIIKTLQERNITEFKILYIDNINVDSS